VAYIPYTIILATQFMEFLGGIADSSADGKIVRLPPVLLQPIAAGDLLLSSPRWRGRQRRTARDG
jgi:hypothetical protein